MFENFVVFIEVSKLSMNTFNNLQNINYHDKLLGLIHRRNVDTFEKIVDLIENKYLATRFIAMLNIPPFNDNYDLKWIKSIFKVIDHIDITAFNNRLISCACSYDFYNFVKYLVKNGADIHTENELPLNSAANNGHLKIVKYLVKKGVNLSLVGWNSVVDSPT